MSYAEWKRRMSNTYFNDLASAVRGFKKISKPDVDVMFVVPDCNIANKEFNKSIFLLNRINYDVSRNSYAVDMPENVKAKAHKQLLEKFALFKEFHHGNVSLVITNFPYNYANPKWKSYVANNIDELKNDHVLPSNKIPDMPKEATSVAQNETPSNNSYETLLDTVVKFKTINPNALVKFNVQINGSLLGLVDKFMMAESRLNELHEIQYEKSSRFYPQSQNHCVESIVELYGAFEKFNADNEGQFSMKIIPPKDNMESVPAKVQMKKYENERKAIASRPVCERCYHCLCDECLENSMHNEEYCVTCSPLRQSAKEVIDSNTYSYEKRIETYNQRRDDIGSDTTCHHCGGCLCDTCLEDEYFDGPTCKICSKLRHKVIAQLSKENPPLRQKYVTLYKEEALHTKANDESDYIAQAEERVAFMDWYRRDFNRILKLYMAIDTAIINGEDVDQNTVRELAHFTDNFNKVIANLNPSAVLLTKLSDEV